MDVLAFMEELLNDVGIEYSFAEEDETYPPPVIIKYKNEEFICDYLFHEDYQLLYVDITIKDVANLDADSYMVANTLRSDYYQCTIYPTTGVEYYFFVIPVLSEKKGNYLLGELDFLINVKNEFERQYKAVHKEENFNIKTVNYMSSSKKENRDEKLYERNILEDAIKLAESKRLI